MPVYALTDPRDGRCRYIGRSRWPRARFRQHLSASHSARMRDWISELRSAGFEPELRMLDGGSEAEWIMRLGPDLNVSRGSTDDGWTKADPLMAEVKLRLSNEDKDRFQAEADKMRLTLSAWLRLAGVEKMEKKGR